MNNPDLDSISAAIGELRSDSHKHTENTTFLVNELRAVGARIDVLTMTAIELREYRKTMHDRLNHIHEIIAIEDRNIDIVMDEQRVFDRRLDRFHHRMDRADTLLTMHWNVLMIAGFITIGVVGWFSGAIPAGLKIIFG